MKKGFLSGRNKKGGGNSEQSPSGVLTAWTNAKFLVTLAAVPSAYGEQNKPLLNAVTHMVS